MKGLVLVGRIIVGAYYLSSALNHWYSRRDSWPSTLPRKGFRSRCLL
jgi:hypothetical protein